MVRGQLARANLARASCAPLARANSTGQSGPDKSGQGTSGSGKLDRANSTAQTRPGKLDRLAGKSLHTLRKDVHNNDQGGFRLLCKSVHTVCSNSAARRTDHLCPLLILRAPHPSLDPSVNPFPIS